MKIQNYIIAMTIVLLSTIVVSYRLAARWYIVVVTTTMMTVRTAMRTIPATMLASKLDSVAHSIKLNKATVVPLVRRTMRASYQAAYHPVEETILPVTRRQDK